MENFYEEAQKEAEKQYPLILDFQIENRGRRLRQKAFIKGAEWLKNQMKKDPRNDKPLQPTRYDKYFETDQVLRLFLKGFNEVMRESSENQKRQRTRRFIAWLEDIEGNAAEAAWEAGYEAGKRERNQ